MKKKAELKKYYDTVVVPELLKLRGYKNKHLVPCLKKIVVNSAISSDWDKAFIADVERDIGAICCQKPVIVKAKKAFLILNCVKVCLMVLKLRCVMIQCTSF